MQHMFAVVVMNMKKTMLLLPTRLLQQRTKIVVALIKHSVPVVHYGKNIRLLSSSLMLTFTGGVLLPLLLTVVATTRHH